MTREPVVRADPHGVLFGELGGRRGCSVHPLPRGCGPLSASAQLATSPVLRAPAQPLKKHPQNQCDAETSLTDPFTGFGGVSSGPFCLVPCATHRTGAHAAPRCDHLREVKGAHPLEGLQQLLIGLRKVLIAFCKGLPPPRSVRAGRCEVVQLHGLIFWQAT